MSHSLEQNEPDQKTILLAEDFEDNAVLMKRLLEMEGYRVLIVGNGRGAVEKTLEVKPGLIILDVSMPVMTGLEACTILKRNEKTRDIPIIFISAHDEKKIKDEALSLGAIRYFTKPVHMEEIFQFISHTLGTAYVERVYNHKVAAPERVTKIRSKDPYRLTGTVLNEKYELVEYAGGGGMGAVYRALRKREGDVVAIKILKPDVVARSPE